MTPAKHKLMKLWEQHLEDHLLCDLEEVEINAAWETVKSEGESIFDELNAARESALLHAVAVDELRRDLTRAQRECVRLRHANQELEVILERVRRAVR